MAVKRGPAAVLEQRTALKDRLRNGSISINHVLRRRPAYIDAATISEILLAVPGYGRGEVVDLLERSRISSSATIEELTDPQIRDLLGCLPEPSSELWVVDRIADDLLTRHASSQADGPQVVLERLLDAARDAGRQAAAAAHAAGDGIDEGAPVRDANERSGVLLRRLSLQRGNEATVQEPEQATVGGYPAKVEALITELLSKQLGNGGWPHWLHSKNPSDSIVATAQVLEILRLHGHGYHSPPTQRGLHYLAGNVETHTHKRGQNTRTPVFALWGLTRYRQAVADPTLREGLEFAVDWLAANALDASRGAQIGGWAAHRDSTELSFTMTTPATDALDRLIADRSRADVAIALTSRARAAIAGCATRKDAFAWWTLAGASDPSAATTIHAILALTGGGIADIELARDGARWLLHHRDEWLTRIERDRCHQDRHWMIMSPSLGLRAVVNPHVCRDATAEDLRPAIRYLLGLWVEEDRGWASIPGEHATTTGCFAVIKAMHALKHQREFDPEVDVPAHDSPDSFASELPYTLKLYLDAMGVELFDPNDRLILRCELQPPQWSMFSALAQQRVAAGPDEHAQSIRLVDLISSADQGVEPGSAEAVMTDLNETLRSASNGRVSDLVERHGHGHSRIENRYRLSSHIGTIVNETRRRR